MDRETLIKLIEEYNNQEVIVDDRYIQPEWLQKMTYEEKQELLEWMEKEGYDTVDGIKNKKSKEKRK
jgi:hypothetical protein